ncbi:histone-lysine N-methyltransferase SETMAR-like [Panonychus citri]|uniref:histone-lysine N-methyltransferase SETMAR-like n=1 Tax=Panonychus citri TaxID=50023 RepID=UPI002307EA8B|nr:histone-lysine N-methyltransferase SETMAR-like [Panonychus citri]
MADSDQVREAADSVMASIEHRAFLKVLARNNWTNHQINSEMVNAFQGACPSVPTMNRWIREFRCGREDLNNQTQREGSLQIDYSKLVHPVRAAIENDRNISIDNLAAMFKVSYGTMHHIVKDLLGMRKLTPRKVPHDLSQAQKDKRVEICKRALEFLEQVGTKFFDYVFTMDETWVSVYSPESRTESLEWVSDPKELSERSTSDKRDPKIMACVFWSADGIITTFWLPQGTTVNAELYRSQLKEVDPLVRRARGKKPLFLQDNARPHKAKDTMEFIKELGWFAIEHPPYSPDLAPSDYFLFKNLKQFLRGKRYPSVEAVKTAVTEFFYSKPPSWFRAGLEALPSRWQKCIDPEGNYFS